MRITTRQQKLFIWTNIPIRLIPLDHLTYWDSVCMAIVATKSKSSVFTCYSHILCGGSAENFVYFVLISNKVIKNKKSWNRVARTCYFARTTTCNVWLIGFQDHAVLAMVFDITKFRRWSIRIPPGTLGR